MAREGDKFHKKIYTLSIFHIVIVKQDRKTVKFNTNRFP